MDPVEQMQGLSDQPQINRIEHTPEQQQALAVHRMSMNIDSQRAIEDEIVASHKESAEKAGFVGAGAVVSADGAFGEVGGPLVGPFGGLRPV